MKNKEVIQSFISGNYGKAGNLMTDGKQLWSYGLLIGETRGAQKIVFDYTIKGRFVSNTTSTHVKMAERAGALLTKRGE